MRFTKNQSGFSAVEIVIVVVVVGVLGLVGYNVYNRQQNKSASSDTSQSSSDQSASADDVKPAPEINSTEDLDKAQAVLDQTDPNTSNNSDTSQLDSQLANF